MIYADHAATTRLSDAALEAMLPWMKEAYGNPSQPYAFSRQPRKAVAEARGTIAECMNAKPEEIYFTSGGTESDNWAIKGTAVVFGKSAEVITSAFEHHAVLRTCEAIAEQGWPVSYLQPSEDGVIMPQTLADRISDSTRLVSVMTANNELGTVQPVRDLAAAAHGRGALFHTDAVQAVGHIPMDVQELGIDLLSASAHKFNGPKGVGFLYIRNGTGITQHQHGGAQEQGMRAGTENVAGIVGMAVALKENTAALLQNQRRLSELENRLLFSLQSLPFVQHCAGRPHLPGLLSLSFPGFDGEAVLHRMDLMGISISTGSACDSKRTVISHVLRAIRLPEKDALGTIRISLGPENTDEDVDAIGAGLRKIVG